VRLPSPPGLADPICDRALMKTVTQGFLDRIEDLGTRIDVAAGADCVLTITTSGTTPVAAGGGGRRIGGLVTVDLSNGRGMAVPIQFTMLTPNETSCPPPTECSVINTTDAPLACAALPPP
jgi:hypothetical protein